MFKPFVASLLLCFLATFTSMATAADKQYGGQLIQIEELSDENIDEEGAHWQSDIIPTSAYKNPYKIVFTVTGTANENGEASIRFNPWWVVEKVKEGQASQMAYDGAEVPAGIPQTLKENASAGETITFVAESDITSFQIAETVMVNAFVENATNFTITKVEASAWADSSDSGMWWKLLLQAPVLLMAVVMIGLIWWWKQ